MAAIKALIVIILFITLCAAMTDRDYAIKFRDWANKYGKRYTAKELPQRLEIFKAKYDMIEAHNAKADEHGFTLGLNAFSDLSQLEFRSQYMGYRPELRTAPKNVDESAPFGMRQSPTSVDWRTAGIVTPIKNQGQCGSCWSFSTTGSTEGQHALMTGTLVSFSEQQLVDCSGSYGDLGCDGGLPDNAFQYIIACGGIETESEYPYTAEDGSCQFQKSDIAGTLSSYKNVQSGSESALQTASATIGPISVAIDASLPSFTNYNGGVYYEANCLSGEDDLDHAVLVVGYGTYQGADYWLVKNSWGTDWGLQGYIMMSRNRDNNCGIATAASYPVAPSAASSTVSTITSSAASTLTNPSQSSTINAGSSSPSQSSSNSNSGSQTSGNSNSGNSNSNSGNSNSNSNSGTGNTQTGGSGQSETGGSGQSQSSDMAGSESGGSESGGSESGGSESGGSESGMSGSESGGSESGMSGSESGGSEGGDSGSDGLFNKLKNLLNR